METETNSPTTGPSATPPSQRTVLVVDDEESIRSLLELILRQDGHAVVSAANGQEAVDVVERDPERFHLVFSDNTMPKMSGMDAFIEVYKRRRDAAAQKGGRVEPLSYIIATGDPIPADKLKEYVLSELAARLRAIGMEEPDIQDILRKTDVLAKPFGIHVVRFLINQALNDKQ